MDKFRDDLEHATICSALEEEFADCIADVDEGPVFWLALPWRSGNAAFWSLAMMVRVPILHYMDVFLFYVPLAELIILIGVATWQGSKKSVGIVTGILLGTVVQGGIWLMFVLFLGLLCGLGDSRENVDYSSKP